MSDAPSRAEEACDAGGRRPRGGRVHRDGVQGTQPPAGRRSRDSGARGGGAARARLRAHDRAQRRDGGAGRHRGVRHAGEHLLDAGAARDLGRRIGGGRRHRGRGVERGRRQAVGAVDQRSGPAPPARSLGGDDRPGTFERAGIPARRPARGGHRPAEHRARFRRQRRVEQLRRRIASGQPSVGAGPQADRAGERPVNAPDGPATRAWVPQRTRGCGDRPGGGADAQRRVHLRRPA